MRRLALLSLLLFARLSLADDRVKFDSAILGGLEPRAIGPAVMGGRVAAIDAIPTSPSLIYVGAASGGVWKSTDGGTTFKPVFEKHPQSIGAIAIDRAKNDTVWVGTGESCVRNSVSVGTGVYKTTDGGTNWTMMGLADSEHIAKIAIDPKHSDTVYVCATGHAWNANEERGVFKTTDGGKSWTKILYVDADTGCSDLAIDPQEPKILYAGMWQFRRRPDFFTSGGAGSGLHKSSDGGATWKRLTAGLPKGEQGRIAVAVAPSRTSVVYALVESKETALYRSDDLGETWTEVNDSFNVGVRPFYFAHVAVDPTDYNRVYKPGLSLGISSDGGKTFTLSAGEAHGDHHAIWIHPKDPAEILLGTDGGVYLSRDKGVNWRFLNSLPISQFYHVSADMDVPYNVYGGLQDNGSWSGPSRAPGGIANRHWRNLGFGDGFHVIADPTDNDIVYAEWQGGNLIRVRRSTGEMKEIKPFASGDESDYRFNWNTPIFASRARPGTIYVGSQYLLRSRDRGEAWERISPDLTTNDKSKQRQLESGGLSRDNSTAENHTTIYAIGESPKNGDVLWVGTDDGNLQLTRDGGKSWTNVVRNVPGVPAATWVSSVEPGHAGEGVAYATFDGHRTGDMKPYAFKTEDFGTTWRPLATADVKGFTHVIREDPVNPKLLFLGTEMGLFVSIDGGESWGHVTENFPQVPVHDLVIHPREGDLIIATHGRGIWIVDDLTPLRSLTPDILQQDVAMLPTRDAAMAILVNEQRSDGNAEFYGPTPGEVATIAYYLRKRHIFGESKVEVFDASGKLVSTLPAGKRKGINRVEWPMRLKAPKIPPASDLIRSGGAFVGPRVPEGTYTVKLVKGKETFASRVTLVPDPRSTHAAADRALQQKTVRQLYDSLERFTFLTDRVVDLRDQARKRANEMKDLAAFADKLDAIHRTLVATREGGFLSGEEQLRERLGMLYGAVNGYDGKPTASQLARMERLELDLAAKEKSAAAALAGLDAINRKLAAKKLAPLALMTREEWEKKKAAAGAGGGAHALRFLEIDVRFPR